MSSARTGAVGTVIGAFVPLSPVVAFLIVIAARVECDGIARAGSSGKPDSINNLLTVLG